MSITTSGYDVSGSRDPFNKVYTLEGTSSNEEHALIGTIPNFGDNFSCEIRAIHTSNEDPTKNGTMFRLILGRLNGTPFYDSGVVIGQYNGFDLGNNTDDFCFEDSTNSFYGWSAIDETFNWKIIVYNIIVL